MNHNSNCEGWARSKLCGQAQVKKSCPKACGLCKPGTYNIKRFSASHHISNPAVGGWIHVFAAVAGPNRQGTRIPSINTAFQQVMVIITYEKIVLFSKPRKNQN